MLSRTLVVGLLLLNFVNIISYLAVVLTVLSAFPFLALFTKERQELYYHYFNNVVWNEDVAYDFSTDLDGVFKEYSWVLAATTSFTNPNMWCMTAIKKSKEVYPWQSTTVGAGNENFMDVGDFAGESVVSFTRFGEAVPFVQYFKAVAGHTSFMKERVSRITTEGELWSIYIDKQEVEETCMSTGSLSYFLQMLLVVSP